MSVLKIKATVIPNIKTKIAGAVSRGIKEIYINNSQHLIFVLTDNSEIDLGRIGGGGGDGGSNSIRIADVYLLANKWEGSASPYSQVVNIDGVTPYSQVDLTPSVEQLTIFHDKDLAFVTENEDGVVTVYAIGDKPTNDYVMQATIKEVSI